MKEFKNNVYVSPFSSRYSSKEMLYIFSNEQKIITWRKLWIALAEAEHELGLPISLEQIQELKDNVNIINHQTARKREKIVKHDVMAEIYAYGELCPNAAKIIHLGATSCYVTDNADIIIMKKGLNLLRKKLLQLLNILSKFAFKYKSLPCLAYTHLQPAQLTTVGKRASLWLQDFYMDYSILVKSLEGLKLLGSKGATGTQASFLNLFKNDEEKVKALEEKIIKKMGFSEAICVSGQTYTRKIDFNVFCALSGIAQSAMKFSGDLRILQAFKELEEPFEENQIGSSAMPYKRNPMKCERVTAIARYVITNLLNPAFTAATQWFERTLDDSANRRIVIPETFLAVDSILNILLNVTSGIVVNEKIINKRVLEQLPFIATENIMMAATKNGGDRQQIHEKLRKHCIESSNLIKKEGKNNDLVERLLNDKTFNISEKDLNYILKPENFIRLSEKHVVEFLNTTINPVLKNDFDENLNKQFELLV